MRSEWVPTKEQEAMGITSTDLMREFPQVTGDPPEDHWPVDEFGKRIPMNEWTVDDLVAFPDERRDWLIKMFKMEKLPAAVKLLEEMSPSQIAQDTALANLRLKEIVQNLK